MYFDTLLDPSLKTIIVHSQKPTTKHLTARIQDFQYHDKLHHNIIIIRKVWFNFKNFAGPKSFLPGASDGGEFVPLLFLYHNEQGK